MKVLCLLLALYLGGCGVEAQPQSGQHQATLRLEFKDGLCSGTAVGHQTILTATHCMAGAELEAVNGRPVEILHREDDGKDHTLLVVNISFLSHAEIGGDLRQGDEVEYWGNPAGIPDLYRKGVVSGTTDGTIFVDASAWKGDSGAGVFKSGKVAGVVTGVFERGQFGLMVALPIQFTDKQLAVIR